MMVTKWSFPFHGVWVSTWTISLCLTPWMEENPTSELPERFSIFQWWEYEIDVSGELVSRTWDKIGCMWSADQIYTLVNVCETGVMVPILTLWVLFNSKWQTWTDQSISQTKHWNWKTLQEKKWELLKDIMPHFLLFLYFVKWQEQRFSWFDHVCSVTLNSNQHITSF